MTDVFVSWSGGKDSSFAAYRAVANGMRVRYLLNMVTEDGNKSWSHGLSTEWLKLQASAIGIPLLQRRTTGADYEQEFKNVLSELRQEGVSNGVFGDIDFAPHREWIERVCRDNGTTPHLPLWQLPQDKIMTGFVAAGFEATVVVTKADLLGEEWVGLKVDRDFLSRLLQLKNVTPCGEAGEYHTFVTDGPLFKQCVELIETRKTLRDGYWFLDILKCGLKDK